MKKLLIVLLLTMLLPAVGIAEIDLKSMTDEQLLLLNKELAVELFSRGKTATVYEGIYIAGETIPVGAYGLSIDPNLKYYFDCAFYTVYKDNASRVDGSFLYDGRIEVDHPIGRIVLESGNILEITDGPVFMRIFSSLEFE
jgi:hypothetical protein